MQDSECLTVTIPEASSLLGISRNLGYDLARRDEFPVRVIHLGKRLIVSKKALLALLDNENEPAPSSEVMQQ